MSNDESGGRTGHEPFHLEADSSDGDPVATAEVFESVAKTLEKFDRDRRVSFEIEVEEIEQ